MKKPKKLYTCEVALGANYGMALSTIVFFRNVKEDCVEYCIGTCCVTSTRCKPITYILKERQK